jgi:hypothetical protein
MTIDLALELTERVEVKRRVSLGGCLRDLEAPWKLRRSPKPKSFGSA